MEEGDSKKLRPNSREWYVDQIRQGRCNSSSSSIQVDEDGDGETNKTTSTSTQQPFPPTNFVNIPIMKRVDFGTRTCPRCEFGVSYKRGHHQSCHLNHLTKHYKPPSIALRDAIIEVCGGPTFFYTFREDLKYHFITKLQWPHHIFYHNISNNNNDDNDNNEAAKHKKKDPSPINDNEDMNGNDTNLIPSQQEEGRGVLPASSTKTAAVISNSNNKNSKGGNSSSKGGINENNISNGNADSNTTSHPSATMTTAAIKSATRETAASATPTGLVQKENGTTTTTTPHYDHIDDHDHCRKDLNHWIRMESTIQIQKAWDAQRRLMRAYIIKSETEKTLKRKNKKRL